MNSDSVGPGCTEIEVSDGRAHGAGGEGDRMSEELKPCPCCRSSTGLYVLQDEKYGEWSVFCDMCKTSFHNENHCDTREEAVSAWNRRAERTCRMEQDPDYDFVRCSACGYEEESNVLVAVDEGGLVVYGGNYCPNCGAKVVDDD